MCCEHKASSVDVALYITQGARLIERHLLGFSFSCSPRFGACFCAGGGDGAVYETTNMRHPGEDQGKTTFFSFAGQGQLIPSNPVLVGLKPINANSP